LPEEIELRPVGSCRWDLVALGEIMLRFDPGDGRISSARSFKVWEGGGEYNVARGLRKCFGLRTTVVTALADNPVGRLIEDLILQGGVDVSHIAWRPYDGIGRAVRNGLNFTERGFGLRGAVGCSDRGHTAASQLKAGEIDWQQVFSVEGARWLHCGGIFAGLSETTAAVAEEAMEVARREGVVVSYDLNFRPSIWQAAGGTQRAIEINRGLVALADVMFGNEEDLEAALGYEIEGARSDYLNLDMQTYATILGRVSADYPNLKLIATSLRRVKSASINDWGGICFASGRLIEEEFLPDVQVLDRVGGGDSFASGLIYGLLTGRDVESSLRYAIAHGALAMTTPGDTSMATLSEVERLVSGRGARIQR
jgi:2-dehydro-3-deoxygluconokinase